MELNLPGLRLQAQGAPEIFGYIGLKMRRIAGLLRGVQVQVERHFVRGFAGAHEPAGEGVFCPGRRMEDDLMRAKTYMG